MLYPRCRRVSPRFSKMSWIQRLASPMASSRLSKVWAAMDGLLLLSPDREAWPDLQIADHEHRRRRGPEDLLGDASKRPSGRAPSAVGGHGNESRPFFA